MNNTMNWPLAKDWVCEICGDNRRPEWGLVHATCYCATCDTPYRMRNKAGDIVTTPICKVKPEWLEVTKSLWNKHDSLNHELEIWLQEFDNLGLPRPETEEDK